MMQDKLFGIHGAALELRARRMELIASNIANAATPGYKARDLDFAAALAAREAGSPEQSAIRYRQPVMSSLDGNTVEMAVEQTAFGENAARYATTLEFLRGRVETVKRALRGE